MCFIGLLALAHPHAIADEDSRNASHSETQPTITLGEATTALSSDGSVKQSFPAKARRSIMPDYPSRAIAKDLGGRVVVCFTVANTGRVKHARIMESTDRLFNKASLNAVKRSEFEPAFEMGRPVSSFACRSFTFRLDELRSDQRS